MEKIYFKPFTFNDLKITVINALWAWHRPGWSALPHSHLCFEFSYVSTGNFVTVLEGQEYVTSSGEANLVPPYVNHSNCKKDPDVDYGFCLRFSLEKIQFDEETASFSFYDQLMLHLTDRKNKAFLFDGEKHVKRFEDAREIGVQIAFIAFLIALSGCDEASLCHDRSTALLDRAVWQKKDEALVNQALHYLRTYKGANFSVQEMVNSLYVSYRHFARVFKKITGKSVLQYYNDIRIKRIKIMLENRNVTMDQIANELGFESLHYVYTFFKKHTGKTPAEYRKVSEEDAK